MRVKSIALFLGIIIVGVGLAQSATIKGKMTDKNSGEPLMMAAVKVMQNGILIKGVSTDFDGNYEVKPLEPGIYDVEFSYFGYKTKMISGFQVGANQIRHLNAKLGEDVLDVGAVEIVAYRKPLIDNNQQVTMTSSRGFRGLRRLQNNPQPGIYYTEQQPVNKKFPKMGEKYNAVKENDYFDPLNEALSTFSIDVDGASYANVRRMINQGYIPHTDAIRIEELINYFDYDYKKPEGDEVFASNMELAPCPWNNEHKLLHVGIKGKVFEQKNLPASNFVYLIDVSGSMGGEQKLGMVKQSIKLMLKKLKREDRVSIVVYAGAAGLVLEPTNDKLKIESALNNLKSGGSTAGGAGIKLAYKVAKDAFIKKGNNRVILCTDGDFNVGTSSQNELVELIEKKRDEANIYLSVLGFGQGNYNEGMMEQLANHGNGNFNYIDNVLEAKKVMYNEMQGTMVTIAKDVKIQVEFNPAMVGEYRLIGYQNRLLDAKDFNDDKKDAGEIGAGHSVTAIYEIIPRKEVSKRVDKLKYQKQAVEPLGEATEWLTLKLRYKKPDENKSTLQEFALTKDAEVASLSNEGNWAASVAMFGMILLDSEYKGNAEMEKVIDRARSAKGKDVFGYRAEFIQLAEKYEILKDQAQ